MTRFLSILSVFLLSTSVVTAAPERFNPPPREIASLAEQLAPLLKANPSLPGKSQAMPVVPQTDEAEIVSESKEPLSPVEDVFSQRAGQELLLYGYNQIGRHISEAPTTGQVQDDVILGTGDKVMVTFRGQRDDSKTYTITPQGELIIKGMEPITASGLTVGALRDRLENETARNLSNSTVFVSVKSLRQIAVTVMGEVTHPGVFTLNPFQTVLDALAMAKGISKNGSLRNIKLLRAGKTVPLDFYKLLMQGDLGTPLQLRDGDKIMVPVLGETIAIAGDVKRPGIYERSLDNSTFNFDDVLRLAGGALRPGANRFVKLSLNSWGDERVTDIAAGDKIGFADGDLLMVTGGMPMRTNSVTVLGHVRQPGPHPLNKVPDLKTLLNNPRVLSDNIYPLIGVIERQDKKTLARTLIDFSPVAVLQGKENKALRERDRVLFFSKDDIHHAMKKKTDRLNEIDKKQFKSALVAGEPDGLKETTSIHAPNALMTPEIVDFLNDRTVAVNGAVLQPGIYPLSGNAALTDIFKAAGGLKPEAARSHVDILDGHKGRNAQHQTINLDRDSPSGIMISSRDKVNVAPRYTTAENRGVQLMGEVKRPGVYDLRKGDTLTDLIERAGGLTEYAAADGTIFMRESERLKQEEQFRNAARNLDVAVAGYFLKKDAPKEDVEEIRHARKIAAELRNIKALGRIVVEANPDVLRQHPEMAILLQQGDRIYIPRYSPTVTVAGEVFSPATLQYNEDVDASDYIKMAGGETKLADMKRGFVVFPNGAASSISGTGKWFGSGTIPAGSTVYVPRDVKPLDTLRLTEGIANILSQVAITGMTAIQLSRENVTYYF